MLHFFESVATRHLELSRNLFFPGGRELGSAVGFCRLKSQEARSNPASGVTQSNKHHGPYSTLLIETDVSSFPLSDV